MKKHHAHDQDLQEIRRIVREEVEALRREPAVDSALLEHEDCSDGPLREDVRQTLEWLRRERPTPMSTWPPKPHGGVANQIPSFDGTRHDLLMRRTDLYGLALASTRNTSNTPSEHSRGWNAKHQSRTSTGLERSVEVSSFAS